MRNTCGSSFNVGLYQAEGGHDRFAREGRVVTHLTEELPSGSVRNAVNNKCSWAPSSLTTECHKCPCQSNLTEALTFILALPDVKTFEIVGTSCCDKTRTPTIRQKDEHENFDIFCTLQTVGTYFCNTTERRLFHERISCGTLQGFQCLSEI